MAKRSILVDFYRVKLPDGMNFRTVLTSLQDTPVERRIFTILRDPMRLENIETTETGQWIGHMVKIRMDLLPRKASVSSPGLQDIDLDPDEGIGEEISFLYDESLNILLYQRNFHGIRIDVFGYYVQKFCGSKGWGNSVLPEFHAIVGTDVIAKLKRQHTMRRLEAIIAVPTNPEALKSLKKNKLTHSWIESINASGSQKMNISLSLGHEREKSLIKDMICAAAEVAIRQQDVVDKFKVRAKEEDHGLEWIDILEDRTHRYVDVDVSRKSPLTHKRMAQVLIGVFDEKATELEAYFKTGER